jgi:hypothetical protein
MAKSGFAEVGTYNPRQECTFKKQIGENGKTIREHIGTDGTSECSLEAKYGAIDPYSSMGYFTTVCRNHLEVPKKIMTNMAEMRRAFQEKGENLSGEKERVNKQVDRKHIDDPTVEHNRKLREDWDSQKSNNKEVKSQDNLVVDLDFLNKLFE